MANIPVEMEQAIGFNIQRVFVLLRRELHRALAEFDLTSEQWLVLIALLHSKERLNQSDLSEICLKDCPTITRMLQVLERDGWITRFRDKNDARTVLIETTDKVRKMKATVKLKLSEVHKKVFSDLSVDQEEELLVLLKLLRKGFGDKVM